MENSKTGIIKTFIASTIGCFLFALGLNAFIIPHHLLAGGLTGIAVILYYTLGIAPGIINIVLNIPILIAAYIWLGRLSVAISVYGAIMVSFFMDSLRFTANYNLTDNPIIGALGGGIICGLGLGIVYRYGATSGGIDPLGLIVRKYYGLQIASVVFILNIVILCFSAYIFNVQIALITLVSLYISATICNKVVLGFQQQKAAFIVSYESKRISEQIMADLGRGVTLLHGEGAFTHERKEVIMAVVGLMQVVKLKNVVSKVDPHAFLLITDTAEVSGGFIKRRKLPQPVIRAMDEQ